MKKILTAAAFTLTLIAGWQFALAEDTKNTSVPPDPDHIEGSPAANASADMPKKMEMGDMKSMMQQCMAMNKDSKMCHHEAKVKCEEQMGQADCAQMMKKMKSAKMNHN